MLTIQTILVPQGAEHRAVCRGLRGISEPPAVFAVPVGAALTPALRRLSQAGCLYSGQTVLVMGLCGGLKPDLTTGSIGLYQSSTTIETNQQQREIKKLAPVQSDFQEYDRELTQQIYLKLRSAKLVKAVTSDRVISRAIDKQHLAHQSDADVVDMEGTVALEWTRRAGATIATLRVVSDDCHADIPDLSQVFSADGALNPLSLTIAMLKQPIAAVRLIRSSTKSLKILQNLTFELFNP